MICKHAFDDTLAAKNQGRPKLDVASAQPILTCRFGLAHSDSNKIGSPLPQLDDADGGKRTQPRLSRVVIIATAADFEGEAPTRLRGAAGLAPLPGGLAEVPSTA